MLKKQFFRFIAVGILSTIVNYLIFLAALHLLLWNYLFASGVGFLSGVFVGFFCNKNWTFLAGDVKSKSIVLSYFAVYATSLAISLIFLQVAVDIIKISPEIANILAIVITTFTNFIGSKFLVFKK